MIWLKLIKICHLRVAFFHLLPHVHSQFRDGRECTVEIDSLKLVGKITRRHLRDELLWIESNQVFLLSEWRRLNP
ncbi:MAG: DUF4160 domain-containing protein [Oxalobacteraceae bacterium]|nr:DUF4160 domain-containing protein [Oxalobacteraceae bacterium]